MKTIQFKHLQEIFVEDLNKLQQLKEETIAERFNDIFTPGIVQSSTQPPFNLAVSGTTIFVGTGIAYDKNANRIEITNPLTVEKTDFLYTYIFLKYKQVPDTSQPFTNPETGEITYPINRDGVEVFTIGSNTSPDQFFATPPVDRDLYIYVGYVIGNDVNVDNPNRQFLKLKTKDFVHNKFVSVEDHLKQVGSAPVTDTNPHGIGINDIPQLETRLTELETRVTKEEFTETILVAPGQDPGNIKDLKLFLDVTNKLTSFFDSSTSTRHDNLTPPNFLVFNGKRHGPTFLDFRIVQDNGFRKPGQTEGNDAFEIAFGPYIDLDKLTQDSVIYLSQIDFGKAKLTATPLADPNFNPNRLDIYILAVIVIINGVKTLLDRRKINFSFGWSSTFQATEPFAPTTRHVETGLTLGLTPITISLQTTGPTTLFSFASPKTIVVSYGGVTASGVSIVIKSGNTILYTINQNFQVIGKRFENVTSIETTGSNPSVVFITFHVVS